MKNLFVVAHRGFSGQYPENTILAFRKAIELGVDFIEIDVHETRDGEPVVIHDHTLERTTNGKGCVKEMAYGEIKKLDAGKWKGEFEDVKVPSLDEVLALVAGKTKLLIEIKEASPGNIMKLVRKHGMESGVVIGSFHLEYVREIRRIAPAVPTVLISEKLPDSADVFVSNGIQIVEVAYNQMDEEKVKEYVSRGISLGIWTVDDENDMKRFIGTDVSFITTNRPDVLKKCLAKAPSR